MAVCSPHNCQLSAGGGTLLNLKWMESANMLLAIIKSDSFSNLDQEETLMGAVKQSPVYHPLIKQYVKKTALSMITIS